ncbi:AraC family transcriptional regulator [Parasalinivibrio latis]|uniref:helix-turn-helix domain-containing protein n=1 Tax=Parasalinivibrio latis TaxID=2952610 RepID=UPI0030DE0EF6
MAEGNGMSDIPHYFLYGEESRTNAPDYLHMDRLEFSLPKHNWEIHPHRHDNLHQLLIIEKGSLLVEMRDKFSEECEVCVLSIPPREVHGFVHQPGVRGYILTISHPFLLNLFSDSERDAFPGLFRESQIVHFDPDGRDGIKLRESLTALLDEYKQGGVTQTAIIGAYLKIVFMLIHRSMPVPEQDTAERDSRVTDYEAFLALLESHYSEQWKVSQYAKALGMTTGRLNRLCDSYAGQNALRLIHERVLTEAKRHLLYTQLSAKEISYKLGFHDPGYFSRFFSRHCGVAPKQFQKQLRGRRDE